HFAKHWRWKDLKIIGYAELWWVPTSSNYLYPIYNFNYSEEALVVGPPILPLLGVRVESQ
ncbi:MAG: hypothetical protein VX278_04625, partial [Myxococcota bacterium]|nr:hypothetical protein [Myxococcota bacterium]